MIAVRGFAIERGEKLQEDRIELIKMNDMKPEIMRRDWHLNCHPD
jgi:hypothetical protein